MYKIRGICDGVANNLETSHGVDSSGGLIGEINTILFSLVFQELSRHFNGIVLGK